MSKWDNRFLTLAAVIATWSKDPSTKVGAVIVDRQRRILGIGYNGFPRGVADDETRLADRPRKLLSTVHAEANAILNASGPVRGASIYCFPLEPCAHCAGLIIQSGIQEVIAPKTETRPEWEEAWAVSRNMFNEAGVSLRRAEIPYLIHNQTDNVEVTASKEIEDAVEGPVVSGTGSE